MPRSAAGAGAAGRGARGADPVVARDDAGRLVVALRDEAGTMHTAAQTVASGDFDSPQNLGGPWPSDGVSARALAEDGRLALAARGEDRHLYHAWQTPPGGEFGPW